MSAGPLPDGFAVRLNRQLALEHWPEPGCRTNATSEDEQALQRTTEFFGCSRLMAAAINAFVA